MKDLAIMNGNAILQIIMSLRGNKNRILKTSINLTRLLLNNISKLVLEMETSRK